MSQEEIVARLWREPFNHTLAEIADLTDGQIALLLRDYDAPTTTLEDGSIVQGSWPRLTKETFWKTWRGAGRPEEWIAAEWARDYAEHYDGPEYDPTAKE